MVIYKDGRVYVAVLPDGSTFETEHYEIFTHRLRKELNDETVVSSQVDPRGEITNSEQKAN